MGYKGERALEYERARRTDPDKKVMIQAAHARYRARKRAQRQLEKKPKPVRSKQSRKVLLSKQRESVSNRRSIRRRLLQQFKSRPCTDCGNSFDPVCMDFDHLPGKTKLFTVSRQVYEAALDDLVDEILKCDLVCSNCHRLRTKYRFQ